MKASPTPLARCEAVEYLGDNRAKFRCVAAGHEFTAPVFPKRRGLPTPTDAGARLLMRWWGRQKDGIRMRCPKCPIL